jgi:hypothetical protein
VVEAVRSCLIGGEVVCCNEHGVTVFSVLRRGGSEVHAFRYAFDLPVLNGTDLRREPIEVRKAPPPLLLSTRCRAVAQTTGGGAPREPAPARRANDCATPMRRA